MRKNLTTILALAALLTLATVHAHGFHYVNSQTDVVQVCNAPLVDNVGAVCILQSHFGADAEGIARIWIVDSVTDPTAGRMNADTNGDGMFDLIQPFCDEISFPLASLGSAPHVRVDLGGAALGNPATGPCPLPADATEGDVFHSE